MSHKKLQVALGLLCVIMFGFFQREKLRGVVDYFQAIRKTCQLAFLQNEFFKNIFESNKTLEMSLMNNVKVHQLRSHQRYSLLQL